MFARIIHFFSYRPYWIALLIACLLFLWMFSGSLEHQPLATKKTAQETLPKVQVTHLIPQQITKSLSLYARSKANSRAVVRAEVAGVIINSLATKGQYVQLGNRLVDIDKNELPVRLGQAKALLDERQLNYDAVKSLNARGLQASIRLAEANSLLLMAKSEVEVLRLMLARTNIRAPFAGILQEQFVEQGDYVKVGDPVFSIENIDPIVFRGDATEHHVNQLSVNQKVTATLLSGEVLSGKLTYVSAVADPRSSTFAVEAQFTNPDLKIFSGISAELVIPLYSVQAVYVSPSALAMDENGNLGVKSVVDGEVVFTAIELVEAGNDGAWLTGFPGAVDIITLGQGFVKPGDRVQAIAAEQ
ncbi:efflux RND transporter periplasmic adaptor subunit [Psychromonas sp.]|uniref:efflux RND transporter periplasmic adaptor subunit n=1 Tax=Psychromonas sp. TaxID=1884585 RepID=UPI003566CA59